MAKQTAKTRLIAAATAAYNETRLSSKVCDQMNAAALSDVIEGIQAMNEVQAHKLEGAICAAEDQSKKGSQKYGWGWEPVHPINYLAFA